MKNKFMKRAIELSKESINSGGGPFGSVIVKNDKIIFLVIKLITITTSEIEAIIIRVAKP